MANRQDIRDALTPDTIDLLDIIGFELFMKVLEVFSGGSLYFPKKESVSRLVRNKMIRDEYDGSNIKILAAKYNISTRHIRVILKQK
jgi:Mor family transcriptional regulator